MKCVTCDCKLPCRCPYCQCPDCGVERKYSGDKINQLRQSITPPGEGYWEVHQFGESANDICTKCGHKLPCDDGSCHCVECDRATKDEA